MKKVLLLAGTKKGLFIFTGSDRECWEMSGQFVTGKEINHGTFDL